MGKVKLILILIIVAALISISGCGKRGKKEEWEVKEVYTQPTGEKQEQKTAEVIKTKVQAVAEGVVTFLSGTVQVNHGEGWSLIDVEDTVKEKDKIQTKNDSFCEIQFSDFCIIRIEENTEVSIKNIFLKEKQNNVNINLEDGNLLCKVKKLAKGENFLVRTRAALCGVRGTEFLVKSKEQRTTVVAVKEGKVAVVPRQVADKIEELKKEVQSEEAKNILNEIALPEIIVTKNQEAVLHEEDVKKAVKHYEELTPFLEKKIKEIDKNAVVLKQKEAKIKTQITKKTVETEKEKKEIVNLKNTILSLKKDLLETAKEKSTIAKKAIKKPVPTTSATIKELRELQKLKPRVILPAVEKIPEKEKKLKKIQKEEEQVVLIKRPVYTKVKIKVVPEDSMIVINNEDSGVGKFSGLYEPGQKLTVVIKKEGYEEVQKTIIVTKEGTQTIKIKLKKASQEKLEKKPEKKIEKKELQKKPIKPTAMERQKAEMILEKKPAELSVKEKSKTLELQEKKVKAEKPKPKPIAWSRKLAQAKPVRSIAFTKGLLVFADYNGRLYNLNSNGNTIWSIKTSNSGNENSSPIVIDGKVYFSGAKELINVDLNTGKIIQKQILGKSDFTSHLFGRRVIKYKDYIVFPSDSSLIFLNPNSLKIEKKILIPGKSNATPRVYKNKILVLNQKGTLLVIDPDNGKVNSKINTDALQPVSLAPVVKNDTAYFAGRKGTVVAINLKENRVIWQKKLKDRKGIFQDITVGEKAVYPYTGKVFYALSRNNGSYIFKPVKSSCNPLYLNNYIYHGDNKGNFIIRSALSGAVIKTLSLDSPITTKPVSVENKIIVGTRSGTIYSLDPNVILEENKN